MKHNKISRFMMLKDGEVSIGTVVKLIAAVAIFFMTYTGGYIIGAFEKEQRQLMVRYIHKICIDKQDYLKCYDYINEAFKKPSRFPAE